jgi:hypothetical protein
MKQQMPRRPKRKEKGEWEKKEALEPKKHKTVGLALSSSSPASASSDAP